VTVLIRNLASMRRDAVRFATTSETARWTERRTSPLVAGHSCRVTTDSPTQDALEARRLIAGG
jgi:hypothetical protein